MPNAHFAGLPGFQGPVARRGEHIDAQVRQVQLAVAADHSLRTDERRGVEDSLAVGLQEPDDGEHAQLAAGFRQPQRAWAGNRFGVRPGFFQVLEAIARQCTLGKYGELGACLRRFTQGIDNPRQVLFPVAESHIHLHARDFHGSSTVGCGNSVHNKRVDGIGSVLRTIALVRWIGVTSVLSRHDGARPRRAMICS